MGKTYITSVQGQKDVVTMLLAKSACHQPTGPCSTCLKFCQEHITDRVYPIIKQSLLAAVRAEDIDAGFGAMMLGIPMMELPNWSPDK